MAKQSILSFHGIDLELLKVSPQDKVSLKLLMLVEGVVWLYRAASLPFGWKRCSFDKKRGERITIQQIIRYWILKCLLLYCPKATYLYKPEKCGTRYKNMAFKKKL
jgi:hypothetical protein